MTSAVRFGFALLLAAGLCFSQTAAPQYLITTVAGTPHVSGDNGPATAAVLRNPQRIAVDRAGSIYFGEGSGYAIRKVTPDGIITTVTGTGVSATASVGPAASSPIDNATGLALDNSGNLYFSEGLSQVRKVSTSGVLSTVAGTSVSGYSGDGGPATKAQFTSIDNLAFDGAGNLYIADHGNHTIRKVDTTGIVTTVAGTGTAGSLGDGGPATAAQLNGPVDVLVDANGNLYIADQNNNRVRKVTPTGIISTYVGTGTAGSGGDGGPALSAQLNRPSGLAMDAAGRLYVSEQSGARVRRITVTATGPEIDTYVGNGTSGFQGDGGLATAAQLDGPVGLAMDSAANLYLADTGTSQRIRKVTPAGIITTVAGVLHFAGDGGPATSARLGFPQSVAVDSQGNIYIADTQNQRIRLVAADGTIRTYTGTGNRGATGDGGPATAATLNSPSGVVLDSAGNLYIADSSNHRIRKVSPAGVISTVAGKGTSGFSGDGGQAVSAALNSPVAVGLDSDGNLYIADQNNNRVRKVNSQGIITTVAGGTAGFAGDGAPATAALLNAPDGVALDSSGNLYIADQNNARVRKVDSKGIITTFAGNGQPISFGGDGGPAAAAGIRNVSSVAVDGAGNVFIGDPNNGRIRMVDPSGIITTVAGSGVRSSSGEGALATAATLGGATSTGYGMAIGPNGVVYLADTLGETIRKLAPNLASQLKIVSGNNQSGATGTQLPGALVVGVLGPTGIPVPGITVSFAVTSGSATLSANSAVTGANGQAGIAVTLGASAGAVAVTASVSGASSAVFNLTATQAIPVPQISAGGVVGAGLSVPTVTALSSNAIVSIFGQNFAPAGSPLAMVGGGDLVAGNLPTQFAGVCVEINSQRAPLFVVTPGQLNLQVPAIPQSGRVTVQVIANCGQPTETRSAAATVAVQAATPEFFFFTHNPDGRNAVAAINAVTAAYVGAPNLIPGASFIPAQPGDFVSVFMTGLGATTPSYGPGVLAPGAAQVIAPVSVSLGGVQLPPGNIPYVGVAPGNAGLYQLNIQIPAGAPTGNVPLAVTVGAFSTPPGGYLTIGQ